MNSRPERPSVAADPSSDRVAVVFQPGPRRVVARVSGEIDMDDATDLREELTAALTASPSGLDVDLTAVTFCDSSGLHVLLDLNRLALDAGKSLVLTSLSRPVARLLSLTGADHVLTVHGRNEFSAQGLQVKASRYGPTVHLTLAGELDLDSRSALDEVDAATGGADVVACDMQDLTLLDDAGLHGLLDLASRLDAGGVAFFAYNWQPQPRQLLDLVDELHPADDTHGRPTRLLRRLQDFAAVARAAGAARARREIQPGVALPPP